MAREIRFLGDVAFLQLTRNYARSTNFLRAQRLHLCPVLDTWRIIRRPIIPKIRIAWATSRREIRLGLVVYPFHEASRSHGEGRSDRSRRPGQGSPGKYAIS